MNRIEKVLILIFCAALLAYVILFNINMPAHFGHGELLVPESFLLVLWWTTVGLNLLAIYISIKDMALRGTKNKAGWIIYILLLSAIGIFHYYLKHGRKPRDYIKLGQGKNLE